MAGAAGADRCQAAGIAQPLGEDASELISQAVSTQVILATMPFARVHSEIPALALGRPRRSPATADTGSATQQPTNGCCGLDCHDRLD
jgi:hypothetical protein